MLNVADYALLTVLALSMGVGLWRGFVVEVLSLTAWVAAFWMTMAFGSTVAGWFGAVESPSARFFLGHAGVFLVVLLLGGGITWAIGKAIANTGLSTTDRVLGVGFGLARGLVLACIAVLLLGFTPAPQDAWWRESALLPRVQRGAEWMAGFLPAAARDQLDFTPGTAPVPPAAPAADGMPAPTREDDGASPAAEGAATSAGDAPDSADAPAPATPVPEN
jgi:membrane protein required for colicin V production